MIFAQAAYARARAALAGPTSTAFAAHCLASIFPAAWQEHEISHQEMQRARWAGVSKNVLDLSIQVGVM